IIIRRSPVRSRPPLPLKTRIKWAQVRCSACAEHRFLCRILPRYFFNVFNASNLLGISGRGKGAAKVARMADLLGAAELELRIALLPPISRGVHLGGPALHARRLVELWRVDDNDDILLAQAFRLLDTSVVEGAIFRTAVAKDYPDDWRYWTLPPLEDLL